MTLLPAQKTILLTSGIASYRESGAGLPVVIVPGLGLTSRFYEQSYATFARNGLRLLVPDLPGTGDTAGPQTGVDADTVCDFLTSFAAGLHLSRAVYIGHSLGTQAVLLLAMRAPAIVAGIGIVGPTGGSERWKLLRQIKGLAVEGVRVRPSVVAAVARDYLRVSPARYLGTWVRHREPVADGRLDQITCPALLVVGERDAVLQREYIALLRTSLRDLTEVVVRDGSHALPRSQHAEFDAAVIAFAQGLHDRQ
jgi:pimeloyl-ACP methyl ester carboxylesterase